MPRPQPSSLSPPPPSASPALASRPRRSCPPEPARQPVRLPCAHSPVRRGRRGRRWRCCRCDKRVGGNVRCFHARVRQQCSAAEIRCPEQLVDLVWRNRRIGIRRRGIGGHPACRTAGPGHHGCGRAGVRSTSCGTGRRPERTCADSHDKNRGNRPSNESMRGIAKEHLVRMRSYPARAQSSRNIAAQCRGDPLRDDEPDSRRHGKARYRCTAIRPRRYGSESDARPQCDENDSRSPLPQRRRR